MRPPAGALDLRDDIGGVAAAQAVVFRELRLVVYRCLERVDALVVADATCNTAPRNPLQVPMTISYLAAQTMTSRNRFLQRAAAATAQDEEVQQYVLDVNENRSVAETLQVLVSLVNDALHPNRREPMTEWSDNCCGHVSGLFRQLSALT
jgi:hypothetical protein